MTNILIESPQFELAHDRSCDCLYATWYGYYAGPPTQANYELILRFVSLTRSTKLLNDGLLDENGWREITTWLAQSYFQRLSEEGIATIAWVLPREVEAFEDTRKLVALLERPLIGTFDDAEAAYNWLHQWPKSGKGSAPPNKK